MKKLTPPILGTLAAIAITTAMDVNGLSVFSALPLLPLMLLLWKLEGLTRVEMGFIWGNRPVYFAAVLYPLVVLGMATVIVFLAGAADLSETNWSHFWINLLAGGASTILVVLLTEEGFFRGWLWASLRRAGRSEKETLFWSSVAFSLWHVSAVSLDTGYDLPAAQIPVYLVTVVLLGLIWGMLRMASGSIVVASVSHGVWNGINYALFAFGTKVGALGVTQTSIYGPEVG
jgi:membrane protease YdiL (CAAX protease family)